MEIIDPTRLIISGKSGSIALTPHLFMRGESYARWREEKL